MVLTEHGVFVEILTELGFVASRVIELFYFVVRPLAVAVRLLAGNMTIIVEIGPSSILIVMETQTSLALMPI